MNFVKACNHIEVTKFTMKPSMKFFCLRGADERSVSFRRYVCGMSTEKMISVQLYVSSLTLRSAALARTALFSVSQPIRREAESICDLLRIH